MWEHNHLGSKETFTSDLREEFYYSMNVPGIRSVCGITHHLCTDDVDPGAGMLLCLTASLDSSLKRYSL